MNIKKRRMDLSVSLHFSESGVEVAIGVFSITLSLKFRQVELICQVIEMHIDIPTLTLEIADCRLKICFFSIHT